jgi:hypothetical protein
MRIEKRISQAKVSVMEFILAFETNWNRFVYMWYCSAVGSAIYHIVMNILFTCQEMKWNCLLVWFAISKDIVVENLLFNDPLTYNKVKEHILKLPSDHCSLSGASSKNYKPQHEANAISLSNSKHDKVRKKWYCSSPNSVGKECTWYHTHSPGTMMGHIWTECIVLKARKDRNSAKMADSI